MGLELRRLSQLRKCWKQIRNVFAFGLITAPVSDWRFYDSMYTERYMKTYEMNEAGYNETAVRNGTGFWEG